MVIEFDISKFSDFIWTCGLTYLALIWFLTIKAKDNITKMKELQGEKV